MSEPARSCECGGKPNIFQVEKDRWEARCSKCHAFVFDASEPLVIERWNTSQLKLHDRDTKTLQFANSPVKDCCKDLRNMRIHRVREDLDVHVCRICGCRHFKMRADPGRLGAALSRLGRVHMNGG